MARHVDRRATITEAGVNHRDEVVRRPAITLLAVARQVLMVLEKAGEGAEVNHR